MSPEEYTSFILQVSREELIAQVPVVDPDCSEPREDLEQPDSGAELGETGSVERQG